MKTIRLLIAITAVAAPLAAETAESPRYNGNGYVAFGAGSCSHEVANISVLGGGDAFLYRGLSLGGEIGYYRFAEPGAAGFGVTALNVGYHFVNRRRPGRLEPFVSVGVLGAAFRESAVAAGSVGGGVNYWFHRRIALRLEGRVYGFQADEALAKFHIGFTFR